MAAVLYRFRGLVSVLVLGLFVWGSYFRVVARPMNIDDVFFHFRAEVGRFIKDPKTLHALIRGGKGFFAI